MLGHCLMCKEPVECLADDGSLTSKLTPYYCEYHRCCNHGYPRRENCPDWECTYMRGVGQLQVELPTVSADALRQLAEKTRDAALKRERAALDAKWTWWGSNHPVPDDLCAHGHSVGTCPFCP